jgi:hypothetical protein
MNKLFTILIFLFCQCSYSQSWVRIYGDTLNTYCYQVKEHYDKGFLFVGYQTDDIGWGSGWIMKTDINGYERWHKWYGSPTSHSPLFSMDRTPDGGMVMIGQTSLQSNWWSAHVIKINACGETEWCRIYSTPQRQVYGLDIQSVPGGGSIAMVGNWGYDFTKILWLLRLDDNGDIVWQQAYATDPLFYDGEGYQLFRTADTNFIITGEVNSPDSGQSNPYRQRPLIIKARPDGTTVFELAWGTALGFKGSGLASVDDLKHNIYSGGQLTRSASPYGQGPCLIKTSGMGKPLFYHDMTDTSAIGGVTTINWFLDSTLVLGMIYKRNGLDTNFILGAMKTDSFGNEIKFKQLLPEANKHINDAEVTFNNKILMVNTEWVISKLQVYAFKLNSDLEYDSIYTRNFNYDSLCPHPIISDTVSMENCHKVVVGLDDARQSPEKTKLRVYPNPAGDQVTVEMPQYLVKQNQGSGITATTTYFQWDRTRLDMLNINGKLMFTQEIPKQQTTVQINTSSWPAGMYLARIVFMNEVVGEAKIVK